MSVAFYVFVGLTRQPTWLAFVVFLELTLRVVARFLLEHFKQNDWKLFLVDESFKICSVLFSCCDSLTCLKGIATLLLFRPGRVPWSLIAVSRAIFAAGTVFACGSKMDTASVLCFVLVASSIDMPYRHSRETLDWLHDYSIRPLVLLNDNRIEKVNEPVLHEFGFTSTELAGKDISVLFPDWSQLNVACGLVQTYGLRRGATERLLFECHIAKLKGRLLVEITCIAFTNSPNFLPKLCQVALFSLSHISKFLSHLKDGSSTVGVDNAIQTADALARTLENVDLMRKYEQGSIKLEESIFNLNAVVEDSIQTVHDLYVQSGVKFSSCIDCDVPLWLKGEVNLLRIVLLNLLANAAVVTKQGTVSFEINMMSLEPSLMLQFSIHDAGPKQDLSKIFLPRWPSSPTIGLGLVVAKKMASMFQAELSVQHRIGIGSTFSLIASFALADGHGSDDLLEGLELKCENISVLMGMRVLLIEGNATNCSSWTETLSQFGCVTVVTKTLEEGFSLIRKSLPIEFHAIILDCNLPNVSEVELIQAFASFKWSADIIIHGTKRIKWDVGQAMFLVEPVKRRSLVEAISQVRTRQLLLDQGREGVKEIKPCFIEADSVLVVEDNDTNRLIMKLMLQERRFIVIEAVNGLEALEKVNNDIVVIFMDVHMAVMGGIEAVNKMQEKKLDIPIVFLTADSNEETQTACEAAGGIMTLTKPITAAILDDTVRYLVPSLRTFGTSSCLVVDVDESNLVPLKLELEKIFDLKVYFATNVEEALCMLDAVPVDLIVFNVKSLTGVSVAEEIQKKTIRDTKLHFVGLYDVDLNNSVLEKFALCKMDAMFQKPVNARCFARLLSNERSTTPKLCLFDDIFVREMDSTTRGRIVSRWVVDSKKHVEQMRNMKNNGQWSLLREASHSLKGSASQFGAILVSWCAKKIEEMCDSLDMSEAEILLQKLEEALLETIEFVASFEKKK